MTSIESASKGRPTTRFWWWAVSILLIVIGVLGFIYGTRTPASGPNIPQPLGKTQLSPSEYGSMTGQTSTTSTSAAPSSVQSGAIPVSLAAWPVSTSSGSDVDTMRDAATTSRPKVPAFIARSRPIHITVPQIGVSASVGVLGLNKDNTVQVPTNFAQPGWYKFGPAPGQRGSAVILGHVDNYKGPAVFFYVNRLRLGSPVIVKLADGYTVRFKVIGVREYSKGHFPAKVVYGMRPYAALQLVTCGGVFDHATGHYESNIVAFTVMTGWTRPRK